MCKILSFIVFGVFALVPNSLGQENPGFSGQWTLDPERSSAVDPWRRIELDLSVEGDELVVSELLTTGRRKVRQIYHVPLGGETSESQVDWWTGNRHIGAFIADDGSMRMSGERVDEGRTLRVESRFTLATSQGEAPVREYAEYRLSPDGETLTRITLRSTRQLPVLHVFNRQQ